MQKKITMKMPRPKPIVSEALEKNYDSVPKQVQSQLDKSKKIKTSLFYPHHTR